MSCTTCVDAPIARAADAQDAAALHEGADAAHRALLDPPVDAPRALGDGAPLQDRPAAAGIRQRRHHGSGGG
ncbi:hypothetical protein [Streptomyces sp. enrichment culture]|uniref:hypothetical protein n=1 Tax=Streptomyces sp. enrichment culture TaxID=1795815 RepID=UPI003F55F30D